MKSMTLEDLTKAELIKWVKGTFFYQPTQRDLIRLRWESMNEEASRIMEEACQESQRWTGIKSFEAIKKWNEAQEMFNKGLALSEKAEVLFKELYEA